MADEYTEVTNQGWFSRIGGAIKGIIVGFILVLVAFPVLWMNEGRSIRRHRDLQEGGKAVVGVDADRILGSNNGKLIHVSGKTITSTELSDPEFSVKTVGLALKRKVEMYQWEEEKSSRTEKKLGGGTETVTTYKYVKKWSDQLISSNGFHEAQDHRNPASFTYPSADWISEDAKLSSYRLKPEHIRLMTDLKPLVPPPGPPPSPTAVVQYKRTPTGFYVGRDPNFASIGDLRISHAYLPPGEDYSIIGRQTGDTFEPWTAKSGRMLEVRAQKGRVSADTMFAAAEAENSMMTWLLRAVGFVLMGIGFSLVLKPLSVIADLVPFIGNIVGAGTGFIGFLIAAGLSLVTIGVAWLFYRPLLSVVLFAAAASIIYLIRKKAGERVALAAVPVITTL